MEQQLNEKEILGAYFLALPFKITSAFTRTQTAKRTRTDKSLNNDFVANGLSKLKGFKHLNTWIPHYLHWNYWEDQSVLSFESLTRFSKLAIHILLSLKDMMNCYVTDPQLYLNCNKYSYLIVSEVDYEQILTITTYQNTLVA